MSRLLFFFKVSIYYLSNECQECPDNCKSCKVDKKCTICTEGFYIHQDRCV